MSNHNCVYDEKPKDINLQNHIILFCEYVICCKCTKVCTMVTSLCTFTLWWVSIFNFLRVGSFILCRSFMQQEYRSYNFPERCFLYLLTISSLSFSSQPPCIVRSRYEIHSFERRFTLGLHYVAILRKQPMKLF